VNSLPEVLLVEDTFDDELMSLRGIRGSGAPCHVTVRRDGLEAIEYLLAPPAPLPSLVVLDYRLPKRSGLEVLNSLRSVDATRAIPVVMFTSTDDDATVSACYRAGANSFVAKPSDPKKYVQRVAQFTNHWLLANPAPDCDSLALSVVDDLAMITYNATRLWETQAESAA
jgi:two-component system response regulator